MRRIVNLVSRARARRILRAHVYCARALYVRAQIRLARETIVNQALARRILRAHVYCARALYVRAQIRLARDSRDYCEPGFNRAAPRRAARIDPSSKLAARCGAADAARPIR